MTKGRARGAGYGAVLFGLLTVAPSLQAQADLGTWVKQTAAGAGGMTMTIETCCNGGRRLTYRAAGVPTAMTVDSPFDGSDAPLLLGGKPSGETMGIQRVDDHHTTTILKMNGKTFGTSKATLSADGKTITVENDITSMAGGQPIGKSSELWVRK